MLQAVAMCKALKFQPSTPFEHGRNYLELVKLQPHMFSIPGQAGKCKPIHVMMVDGGHDENPRFVTTILTLAVMFIKLGAEGLVCFTRAGGYSSFNPVERTNCFYTRALAGCRFPSDHFGKVDLGADNKPRTPEDADLERRNLQHAVEGCADVLRGSLAHGRKVRWVPL